MIDGTPRLDPGSILQTAFGFWSSKLQFEVIHLSGASSAVVAYK